MGLSVHCAYSMRSRCTRREEAIPRLRGGFAVAVARAELGESLLELLRRRTGEVLAVEHGVAAGFGQVPGKRERGASSRDPGFWTHAYRVRRLGLRPAG